MKKYIGYIRVSNKDHENSLPAQRQKLRDYAVVKEFNLIKIYEEEKSAFRKSDRKVFRQMTEHLKQDDIAGVVFHKVDRSSRNMKDFALLEEFFDKKDIRVIEGEFDTKKSQGRFQFRMFCNMAVWYSENLSEEVTLKMKERLKLGYYPTNPPLGYRKGDKKIDTDWKKKHPDHNAKYVREMFELYDTGNYSYFSLAKFMHKKGVRNSQGGRVSKGIIERVLKDRFYYGIIDWRSSKTGEITTYEGNHEPIISAELYERVKNRRQGRVNTKGGSGKQTYSRMLNCACGRLLYPETPTSRSGSRDYTYLRCQNKDCDFKSINENVMEDLIVEELRKYQIKPEFFAEYKNGMMEMNEMIFKEGEEQRESINQRLAQIEAEKQRIRQGFIQGLFEAEEATSLRKDLEAEKTELLNRLNRESNAMDEAYFKTAEHFLETFQILADKYKTAKPEIKREVLDLFFSKRILKDGKTLFKPNTIVKQVSLIANLSNGRGGRTRTGGLVVPNHAR